MSSGINDLIEHELASLNRAYAAGTLGAALDAAELCFEHDHKPPEWVRRALFDMAVCAITGDSKYQKWARRYRKDMIEFMRYEAVLEAWGEYAHESPPIAQHKQNNNTDGYHVASLILQGTDATGSRDSMEASYKKVRRSKKTHPLRYLVLSNFVQRLTGLHPEKDAQPLTSRRIQVWKQIRQILATNRARRPR
jgi:hypothetical protein